MTVAPLRCTRVTITLHSFMCVSGAGGGGFAAAPDSHAVVGRQRKPVQIWVLPGVLPAFNAAAGIKQATPMPPGQVVGRGGAGVAAAPSRPPRLVAPIWTKLV